MLRFFAILKGERLLMVSILIKKNLEFSRKTFSFTLEFIMFRLLVEVTLLLIYYCMPLFFALKLACWHKTNTKDLFSSSEFTNTLVFHTHFAFAGKSTASH